MPTVLTVRLGLTHTAQKKGLLFLENVNKLRVCSDLMNKTLTENFIFVLCQSLMTFPGKLKHAQS